MTSKLNSSRDSWDRLVVGVLRREQLRQIALSHSRSPSTSSTESSFTSSSSVDQMSIGSLTKFPSHKAIVKANSARVQKIGGEAKRRDEIARMRELHTLTGKLDAAIRLKGIDLEKVQKYHTI